MIDGGGVEKNFFIIANYFAKHFRKVTVITTSKNYKSKLDDRIEFIGPTNIFWNKTHNRRFKIFICLYLVFKYFLKNKKFTVLSFHGNLYCCLLCKILRQRIILRSNASISGWSKSFIKNFIYKNISKMANKIIVNSLDFKKEYSFKFNLEVECIYNPLNKYEIIKKSKIKTKIPHFRNNTINFINVGRLVDQKNQMIILKTFKKLKLNNKLNFKLLIIGRGKNHSVLKNFIIKNHLTNYIKIIDYKENPFPYIKSSDVFILSSLYEGLPNVLLEALALKKIVISSNCPTGPKEILDNGKGGLLFDFKNENDLYKKINFYLNNKNICKKLTLYGHKRLKRFDLNINLKKYISAMIV